MGMVIVMAITEEAQESTVKKGFWEDYFLLERALYISAGMKLTYIWGRGALHQSFEPGVTAGLML